MEEESTVSQLDQFKNKLAHEITPCKPTQDFGDLVAISRLLPDYMDFSQISGKNLDMILDIVENFLSNSQ